MIRFERITDLSLVKTVFTHPKVWRRIGDDDSGAPQAFVPNPDPRIWYLAARSDEKPIGIFSLIPESRVCCEIHVAILPQYWGAVAHLAGNRILPWIWRHTGFRRVSARVPSFNHLAIRYGMHTMGLEYCGVNFESFLKHGRLYDQILLGASRPSELPPARFI